jgi:hypothetical protein
VPGGGGVGDVVLLEGLLGVILRKVWGGIRTLTTVCEVVRAEVSDRTTVERIASRVADLMEEG